MPTSHNHYDFQAKTAELNMQTGTCDDFDRLAEPYLDAAKWERDNGNTISVAVGMNSAVDMDQAAGRLAEYRSKCTDCGAQACLFAGVERISPTDLSEVLAS